MEPDHWYELRLEGSVGTSRGRADGIRDGIAIANSGHLCAIASGQARRFTTEREAKEYLLETTLPALYGFEVVLCSYQAAAQ